MDKRVLTIQDISCFGQCSLTVALPIISACGFETSVVPSSVLSTHTTGFKNFTFRDLSEDLPKINKHWVSEKIFFDAIYTGYLGSVKQIDYVIDFIDSVLKKDGLVIIDPAMADNGKLYPLFNDEYVKAMKKLINIADYILPNITEACFLTNTEYKEIYDEQYIILLADKLKALGAKNVILTGVSFAEDELGVYVFTKSSSSYYKHERIKKGSHGTGDVYASCFVGALLNDKNPYEAAKIAADYVVKCIKLTQKDPNHAYGVKFEPLLKDLILQIVK